MGKLIYKDFNKIVIEITKIEYEEKGFDTIWDEIRIVYKEEYQLSEYYYSNNNKIINFVLKNKTNN